MNTKPRTLSALNRPALMIVIAGILAAAHLTGGTMLTATTPYGPITGSVPAVVAVR